MFTVDTEPLRRTTITGGDTIVNRNRERTIDRSNEKISRGTLARFCDTHRNLKRLSHHPNGSRTTGLVE